MKSDCGPQSGTPRYSAYERQVVSGMTHDPGPGALQSFPFRLFAPPFERVAAVLAQPYTHQSVSYLDDEKYSHCLTGGSTTLSSSVPKMSDWEAMPARSAEALNGPSTMPEWGVVMRYGPSSIPYEWDSVSRPENDGGGVTSPA